MQEKDELLEKAAQGCVKSQMEAAFAYRYGVSGLDEDATKALGFYESASSQGDFIASIELGKAYSDESNDLGVGLDIVKAKELLNKSLEQGAGAGGYFAMAQLNDELGEGEQALTNYQKVIDGDSGALIVAAMYRSGVLCENGIGCKQDYEKAAGFYEIAGLNGSIAACSAMSSMCRDGRGVEQSDEQAWRWKNAAKKLGNNDAGISPFKSFFNSRGFAQVAPLASSTEASVPNIKLPSFR